MSNGAEISLTEGFNDKQYHATLFKNYKEHIDLVAKAGYKNLICFSGNRSGMDDETGLKNCAGWVKKPDVAG
jgi:hydroxypyruvate isomerase